MAMNSHNLLLHRTFQWIAVISVLAVLGGGYWYWKNAQAGVEMDDNRPSFEAPLTHDLNLTRGQGSPTYSRSDGADRRATVTDFEGLIRPVKSGEARFEGARRVENRLAYSEAFDNAAWTKTGTSTLTANTGTAPDGTQTADQLVTTTTSNYQVRQSTTIPKAGEVVTFSIWARQTAGTAASLTMDVNDGIQTNIALTSYWQRFSVSGTPGSSSTNVFTDLTFTQTGTYELWGAQLEITTGQANQNPSEYVSVGVKTSAPYHGSGVDGVKYFDTENGNTVASNVVTEATGAVIATATLKGYLSEGARTNLITYSEQFENSNFIPRASVSANVIVAPDGRSTADKLTEDATATNTHYARRTGVAVSGTTYSYSVFAKAGERTWLALGSNWVNTFGAYFDLSNGTVGTVVGSASASIVSVGNGWYRCTISGVWNDVYVDTLLASGNGGMTYTGDGSSGLYLWGAQLEQASFSSSYIPTTSATVTRAVDSLRYPETGNFNDTAGTVSLETTPNWTGGLGWNAHWVADSSSGVKLRIWHWTGSANHTGVDRSANNGATRNQIDPSLTLTQGTMIKIATKWDGTALRQFNNGALAGSDTTLTLPYDSLANSLYIGSNNTVDHAFSSIRNVRAWKKALTDTELNNLTSLTQATSDSAIKETTVKAPDNTGLVGYWSFEDGSGTQATDFSNNDNTGTLTNGPTWTDGKIGKALSFNDQTTYMRASSLDNGNFPVNGSISLWLKADDFTSWRGVFDNYSSTRNHLFIRIYPPNNLQIAIQKNDASSYKFVTTTTLTVDQWAHFVVSWNTDNDSIVVYKNGALHASGAISDSTWIPNEQSLTLGAFPGQLDDVRIYDRSLSQAEITGLYRSGSITKLNTSQNNQLTDGLVGLWSFNGPDISGTTAYDRSGQGNNGTLTNGPTKTIGKVGQALNFNGTNSFVNLPNIAALKPTGGYSVSFWYKGLKGSTETFIGHSSSVLSNFWYIDNTKALFCGGTNCNSSTEKTYALPNDDSWHHLVASLDRNASPDTLTVYIDGVSQGTASGDANGAPTGWGSNTLIGAPSWNNNGYRQGPIDEVRIYDHALTQTEISALYSAGR